MKLILLFEMLPPFMFLPYRVNVVKKWSLLTDFVSAELFIRSPSRDSVVLFVYRLICPRRLVCILHVLTIYCVIYSSASRLSRQISSLFCWNLTKSVKNCFLLRIFMSCVAYVRWFYVKVHHLTKKKFLLLFKNTKNSFFFLCSIVKLLLLGIN